jgi:hypothetical protein
VRDLVETVEEYELNDYEKNLVDAILWYIDEVEEEFEDFGYDMLNDLQEDILNRREYDVALGLKKGEEAEWSDEYESIMIYHSD